MKYYLGIDIGASSGRHIVGYIDNNNVFKTEEIYRFSNGFNEYNNHLIWDIDKLFIEVKNGIKLCLEKYPQIESMSIDTWGVDYVLLQNNKTIYPVYAYRDSRTNDIIDEVHKIISFDRLYEITGSQFQPFNTIYQLYDDFKNDRLKDVTDFLYIPEYLIYKLTGVKKHEKTIASTSGMLDTKTKEYSSKIIELLGLNKNLFKKLDTPKEEVGYFLEEVQKEVKGNIKVVLCPMHDTASAVEGMDVNEKSIYISSGTWSLIGVKTKEPISTNESKLANYSNEYGPEYIRFQKNIMGLWIIQCLSKEMNIGFTEIVEKARTSQYKEIFDVNDNCFLDSKNMKNEIINWFKRNNKELPISDSDILMTTCSSLAYSYKVAIEELENITNTLYENIVIVGGGAKNELINELTRLYTGKEVIAKAIEATAIGNLKTQMEK